MSGNTPFITLHQGGPAPAQASQGQGNPVPMNQAAGHGAVPRVMMPSPQQQYQQQPQIHPQQLHTQHQQPHHAAVPRHPGASTQWSPEELRQRRVVEKSDIRQERMTEADMRESLSEYKIYRLEKVSGEHDEDDEDRIAKPTWENVLITENRDMPNRVAARHVQKLDREGKSCMEKKEALILAQKRQVELLQDRLEEGEADARYCHVLAQLERQTDKITDEEYVLDERNWDRLTKKERQQAKYYNSKGGKKVSVSAPFRSSPKEKQKKLGKKVTTSITAFYKRTPRRDADVAAMYQEKLAKSGHPGNSAEDERTYQQHRGAFPRPQPMQGQQHQGVHYPPHSQYPQGAQFQHPQHPQHPQQHQPYHQQTQQQFHHSQYTQQYPHPAQQTQLPVRTKTPLQAAAKMPVVVHGAPAPEIKSEPSGVKVMQTNQPARKTKHREKHYHSPSARSSSSSFSEDIFSIDTETTRSSAPSDAWGDKRGRTKRRGKGRRARSDSAEWSRSRSRGASNRPEFHGVRRQHVLDGYARYASPSMGGSGASGAVPPPPTEPGITPAALKTVFELFGKMQGQRDGVRPLDEPVSPRVGDVKRPATRGREEDEAWAGDGAYERRGYGMFEGQGGRAHEKVYSPADKAYHPTDNAYHPSDGASSRAYGKEYYPAPAQAYDRQYHPASTQVYDRQYRPASDDYSDDYEYTHIPAPRARPLSPERKDYDREAFRRPRYAEEPYLSGGRSQEREEAYMCGGLRNREERPNPFAPRQRYDFES